MLSFIAGTKSLWMCTYINICVLLVFLCVCMCKATSIKKKKKVEEGSKIGRTYVKGQSSEITILSLICQPNM